jgi:hypothetical protein
MTPVLSAAAGARDVLPTGCAAAVKPPAAAAAMTNPTEKVATVDAEINCHPRVRRANTLLAVFLIGT